LQAQSGPGLFYKVTTVVATLVAIGALAVAVLALSRTHTTKVAHPVGAAAVASFGQEVRQLKTELAAAQAAAGKTQAQLTKVTTCLPELQSQINGQTVETGYREIGGERYLTDAYLKSGPQLSTYCKSTLVPESSGH
jgi:hypothetical protein